jgi:hypothetical protein
VNEGMNAFHQAGERQVDQGKDGGNNTHEHGTSLKRLIFCSVDDKKKNFIVTVA